MKAVSYPEVFINHPDIHRVYRIGMTSYFYDDYIKDKDTIVFKHEPYFTIFMKGYGIDI